MKVFNCLIVDDEPIARQIILSYCGHLPYVKVIASCRNAFEAKEELTKNRIDIVFLDIKMPVLDGISLGRTLRDSPAIIYTTAYKEFAVDAFELAAADYLVKPFSLDRFIAAVDKAVDQLTISYSKENRLNEESFFLKTVGKVYKIYFDDVLYAEASGNYVKVTTVDGSISSIMTFSKLEEQLPPSLFFRVHRSFIVNKSKITRIEGNRLFLKEVEVPLGSSYRESFYKEIGLN